MNLCATTNLDIHECGCGVCAPLRRIKEASAARRREVFKHRTGAHKKGVGHWWMGKLKEHALKLGDAELPKGDRE